MTFLPRSDCQIPSLARLYAEHLPAGPGRFVEVGAYDGVTVSNTVFLAEAGWTGLYIEPHPDSAAKCRENHAGRPGIQVLETAIGRAAGQASLYLIGECSTLVWDKSAVDWGGSQERKIEVPMVTLDAALAEAGWLPGFELLVIDVEQSELEVLAGFSVTRWRPGLVIIEAHEKDAEPARNCKASGINNYFAGYGYTKIYADAINSVFLRGH